MSRHNDNLLIGLYQSYRPLFNLLLAAGRSSYPGTPRIYLLSLGSDGSQKFARYTARCRDLTISDCQALETYRPQNESQRAFLRQLMPQLTDKDVSVVRVVTNAVKYQDGPTRRVGPTLLVGFIDLAIEEEPKFGYIRLH